MSKPYKEKILSENIVLRSFHKHVMQSELVWHRDHEDRKIKILEGSGWHFQRDNELPFLLHEGDIIKISAKEYHRLIKGNTKLIVKIIKN